MQENPTITAELPKDSFQKNQNRGARPTAFIASVGVLVGVLVISWVLLLMTTMTNASIGSTNKKIDELTAQINTAKQNKQIIIADILGKNLVKPSIDLKKIVGNFMSASSMAQVRLQGFSIQDDVISTNLIATGVPTGATHTDPVQLVIKMMRDYSSGKGVNTFALEPISSISGDGTSRSTSIQFKVVPVTAQAPNNSENASNTSNQ